MARPPKSLGVAQKGIIKPEHQVKKNRSVMFALSPQQPTTADGVPTSAPPDAHVFWQQYISQRQPVCLSQIPDDLAHLQHTWSLSYLAQHLGNTKVKVEERPNDAASFGRGTTTTMTFARFASQLTQGNTNLYLSTQDVPLADDGLPELLSPMMDKLKQDLPITPAIMGALVPHAVNMWIGCAPEGSSSGLHHDYHDNLYVLLRGSKRFRLYPSSMATKMYTHGTIKVVAANGLICYKEQPPMEDDGVDSTVVASWLRRHKVEEELHAAEAAVAAMTKPTKEALARVQAAEAALDALMEGQLNEDMNVDEAPITRGKRAKQQGVQEGEPLSFSAVDLNQPESGKGAALEVTVHAGQALYVPAGWFHEVTSMGDAGSAQDNPAGVHMALNYWFYPPDALRDVDGQHPYKSTFLPWVWTQRCKQHSWACNQPAAPPASLAPAAALPFGAVGEDDDDEEDEEEYKPTDQEEKMMAGMGRTSMRNDALKGVAKAMGFWHRRYWRVYTQDYWTKVQMDVRKMMRGSRL